ncbi:response regulator transcription factor [Nocardioides anomalus]|uniref:Response regulator transcription factor n=1 Tax=Nocardioides anomalus TaxID=2712223 RepID=A0A6G6W9R1_9ACTN|nr:response regulator transcription factor [Nocardioides anomalus]QIG42078.1 response regulator transcription factor [Nocardioides anomalus]
MQQGRPVRVAIVNDYELVVVGVAALLEPFRDRVRVIEVDSNLPVVREVDVILYDTFGQVQGKGVDVDSLVDGGRAKVVIYSWNLHAELVQESLEAGASGYLSKGMDAEELVRALEAVHEGRRVVPKGGGTVNPRPESSYPGKEQGLTVRESEIIALITQGLSNQEIADRSYLSINSVKTYIRTAYRKMGVERRSQAVLWGIQHGFQPDVVRHVQPSQPQDG